MASASQCYNATLYSTAGTTLRSVFNYSGPITGTQTVVATVNGTVTFEGNSTIESTATTTGTNTVSGITVPTDTEVKTYQSAAANGQTTLYGATGRTTQSVAGFAFSTTFKTVYSPPFVNLQFTLTAGQTITQNYAGTTTTTTAAGATSASTTVNQSLRFVGIESVTVPAGTFSTCKFEQWDNATPTQITTSYLAVGNGALVKSTGVSSQGTQTISATQLVLNGTSL